MGEKFPNNNYLKEKRKKSLKFEMIYGFFIYPSLSLLYSVPHSTLIRFIMKFNKVNHITPDEFVEKEFKDLAKKWNLL